MPYNKDMPRGPKPGQKARVYTAEETATILAMWEANGGNVKKTARDAGISVSTLKKWVMRKRFEKPDVIGKIKEKKRDLYMSLEDLVFRIIEVLPRQIDTATFAQLMVGLGIGIDKLLAINASYQQKVGETPNGVHIERLIAKINHRATAVSTNGSAPEPH